MKLQSFEIDSYSGTISVWMLDKISPIEILFFSSGEFLNHVNKLTDFSNAYKSLISR